MSIETLIQNLIDAVNRNTEALNKPFVAPGDIVANSVTAHTPVQPATSVPAGYPPVVNPVPAPTMPPPPTFSAPPAMMEQPQPTQSAAPFNDIAGLIKYATDKYYALGANANKIGDIITGMGHPSINEIRPDQFKHFYDQVELIQKG